MTKEEKNCVFMIFIKCFGWMNLSDVVVLYEKLGDEIVQDIEETADADFNDSDIRIAIRRVLFKRINIEN